MITSLVLAVSSLSAAMPLFLSENASAIPVNTIVDQNNMNGWTIKNQDPATVTGAFVNGPSGAGSVGSGSFQVDSPSGKKMIVYNTSTYGQKLNSLTQLSYSTFVSARSASTVVAPAIDINAIINGQWTTLVYEPTYTNNDTATGNWQPWNTLNGKWWSTKDLKDTSSNVIVHAFNDFVPWSTITSLDTNATISSDGVVGGVQVVVGQNSGGSPWSNFTGAFDNVNINGTVYDFEPVTVPACTGVSSFDTFNNGNINSQQGWQSTGSYDQAIVDNTYGHANFGCKSLRISNAVTTRGFGNQTFSNPATPAGEASTGATNNHYEASFDIASTKSVVQPGLTLSVSPDDGTGNRMSYLRFEDQTDGIHVYFDDVSGTTSPVNFNESEIAILTRAPHTVKFVIDYNTGASNDVVKVYIDGALQITGTTWENYYRYDNEQSGNGNVLPRADRLLFRAGGTAVPANSGNGFLFDNVDVSTSTVVPASPLNPRWLNHVGDTLGAFTNVNQVTPAWSVPATGTVDHYNYSYTSPTNSSWSAPSVFTGTSILDQAFGGAGNNGVEGPWQFKVQAVDQYGNMSLWVESPIITYDKTAPTGLTHVSPTDGTMTNTAGLASIDWTDATDVNGPVTYYYQSSHSAVTNLDGSFVSPAYSSSALSSSMIPTPGTPEGTYYWHVRAVDGVGNSTPWTAAWMVVVDNTAPTVPTAALTANSISVPNGGGTNSSTFTFNLGSSLDTTRYQLKYWNDITGSLFKISSPWSPTNLSSYSSSLGVYNDHFTQGDGTHYFAFSACDAANNCSAFSAPYEVTFDATAPLLTVGSYTGTSLTPTLTGTTDGATDTVKVDGGTATVSSILNGGGTYDWTYTLPTQAIGSHTITVTSTDNHGNATSENANVTVQQTPATETTPAATTTTITPTGTTTNTTGAAVLGETTTNNAADTTGNSGVEGATDSKTKTAAASTDNNGSSDLFGLAWYWWLLILAGIAAIVAWIIAAIRRRKEENA